MSIRFLVAYRAEYILFALGRHSCLFAAVLLKTHFSDGAIRPTPQKQNAPRITGARCLIPLLRITRRGDPQLW